MPNLDQRIAKLEEKLGNESTNYRIILIREDEDAEIARVKDRAETGHDGPYITVRLVKPKRSEKP